MSVSPDEAKLLGAMLVVLGFTLLLLIIGVDPEARAMLWPPT